MIYSQVQIGTYQRYDRLSDNMGSANIVLDLYANLVSLNAFDECGQQYEDVTNFVSTPEKERNGWLSKERDIASDVSKEVLK